MKKRSIFSKTDPKTARWILALAAVCLICGVLFACLRARSAGSIAVVRVDGEALYRIDLSTVKESYRIALDTKYGHNTILVEPGRISVSAADCPDGLCVAQGAISRGGVPVICMPHHLSVRIEGGGIDG